LFGCNGQSLPRAIVEWAYRLQRNDDRAADTAASTVRLSFLRPGDRESEIAFCSGIQPLRQLPAAAADQRLKLL